MLKNQSPFAKEVIRFTANTIVSLVNEQRARNLKEPLHYIQFTLPSALPPLPDVRNFIQQRLLGRNPMTLMGFGLALERLTDVATVEGIVLMLPSFAMGLADLQTLRDYLVQYRQQGKRIIAYTQSLEMANYFIASAADEIWLAPAGGMMTTGLVRQQVFLKNALETVGVEADVIAITPFKSAADQLSRTEPSPEGEAQVNWLLDSEYHILTDTIASGRGMSSEAVKTMVDNAPYTDLQALEQGYINRITSEEGFPALLDGKRLMTWEKAESVLPLHLQLDDEQIVVLPLVGTIVNGPSVNPPVNIPLPLLGGPRMGDVTVVQQVRELMGDESVKAVVLFINSPGGSASASEAMVSALAELAKTRPVVVVMGDVAASGGYYIATAADWIIAQPGTITGSIGVVLAKLVTNDMLRKLRFNPFTYLRGANAAIFTSIAPFTDEQRAKMRDYMTRVYDVFVQRVADARKLKPEQVDAIGGGRVWTGEQAMAHGLVDELGGLEAGIAKARRLANLPSTTPVRVFRGVPRQPLVAQIAEKVNPAAALNYWFSGLSELTRGQALYMSDKEWR